LESLAHPVEPFDAVVEFSPQPADHPLLHAQPAHIDRPVLMELAPARLLHLVPLPLDSAHPRLLHVVPQFIEQRSEPRTLVI
jgi:hypothetical protein